MRKDFSSKCWGVTACLCGGQNGRVLVVRAGTAPGQSLGGQGPEVLYIPAALRGAGTEAHDHKAIEDSDRSEDGPN